MSQALCLVDAKQVSLVVCNQRYQELFGFDRHLLKAGTPIRHLFEFLSASGDDKHGLERIFANQQALIGKERSARTYFRRAWRRANPFGISHPAAQ